MSVVLIPFSAAFVAEYLNTPLAQPAITIFCVNGLLHNIGWLVLYRSVLRPKPLVHPELVPRIKLETVSIWGAFALYCSLVLVSIWFPIAALVLNFLSWCYWLYFAIRMKPEKSQG